MDGYIKKADLEADLIRRGFYPAIVKRALEETPCADVVAVVRCKDCAHYMQVPGQYNYRGKPAMYCLWHSRLVPEYGYCSEAIRKENEDE